MMLRSLLVLSITLMIMQPPAAYGQGPAKSGEGGSNGNPGGFDFLRCKKDPVVVKIKEDGAVILPEELPLKAKDLKRLHEDDSELKAWERREVKKAKRDISQNIADALDFLRDRQRSDEMLQFYNSYLGQTELAGLVEDMDRIKKKLDDTTGYQLTNSKNWKSAGTLALLDKVIDSMLKTDFYKVVKTVTDSRVDIKVYKTDPYKAILAAYYNETMQLRDNRSVKDNASIAQLNALTDDASRAQQIMASIDDKEFSIELLNQIYNVYIQKETKLEQFGRAPWFRQWFWKTGGVINTTPLGFTDDQKVRYPNGAVDTASQRKFIDFLNAATGKFLADTNARDVMIYKNTVLDYYTKNTLFLDSSLIKERASLNQKLRNNYLSYKEFATHLQMPSPHGFRTSEHLYFSADNPPEGQQQLRSLTKDDHISVAVFNVPKDQEASVQLTSAKPIDDQSQLTAGLSSSFETLGEALTIAEPITGTVRGLLAAASHKQKPVNDLIKQTNALEKLKGRQTFILDKITYQIDQVRSMTSGIVSSTEDYKSTRHSVDWPEIKTILKAQHKEIIDAQINSFARIKGIADLEFDEGHFLSMQKDKKYEDKKLTLDTIKKMIITDYTAHFINTRVAPIVIGTVSKEFITREYHLAQLINIIRTSSAPMEKVAPKEATEASYGTMLKEIAVKDSATNREYEVVTTTTANGKSTNNTLTSFTYKTGKRFWIQPSLGAAYSFASIKRNKVTDKDGLLQVESNTQQLSAVVALHFYPINGGVFLQDRNFFGGGGRNVLGRINIMAGIDFLNIPDNLFFGLGYDLGPGLKINMGVQLYKYTYYNVRNDVIVSEQQAYRAAFPFLYIGIDPVVAAKGIASVF